MFPRLYEVESCTKQRSSGTLNKTACAQAVFSLRLGPTNAEIVMHTHAKKIVGEFVHQHLKLIHAARQALWCAAVSAVMAGQMLTLLRLARGLTGQGTHKAALKRVDRLLGNARIARETEVIAAALLRTWCQRAELPLVIAVDWSEVAPGGAFVELRAVLTRKGMGWGLTIYQQVYPLAQLGNAHAERRLLEQLREWVPRHVPVMITSDAGFRRPWFTAVQRLGWDWIGRARGRMHLARWRAVEGCTSVVWQSHPQSMPLESMRAVAPIPFYLRPGAVSAPRAVGEALCAPRSRFEPQGAPRSASQRPRAMAARALAAAPHFAARGNRRLVWPAHANRGELPRQQIDSPRHGPGVQ